MRDPLFSYERFGFSFQLFDDRIETATRQFLGTTKADTLLLRQVSSVQTKPGKLILTLNDGSAREFVLGRQTDEAKRAILARL